MRRSKTQGFSMHSAIKGREESAAIEEAADAMIDELRNGSVLYFGDLLSGTHDARSNLRLARAILKRIANVKNGYCVAIQKFNTDWVNFTIFQIGMTKAYFREYENDRMAA